MKYISDNKAAWEEAFDNRKPNWGENNHIKIRSERLAFFNADMKKELEQIAFQDKTIAQFCCNNGRELLSLMDCGAKAGTGFDIAENIIGQARTTVEKLNMKNCDFVACDILAIPESYHDRFDFILFTIGAITWFEDLTLLFNKVSKCLKKGGLLMINDYHPLMNMLPLPSEDAFDSDHLNQLAYSYFREDPWIENSGQSYMSKDCGSKTFTSFSHTMSSIINSLSINDLKTIRLNEYDYDIGLTEVYDNKGLPLSYILIAEKGQ